MITTEPNYNAIVIFDEDQAMGLYPWYAKRFPTSNQHELSVLNERTYLRMVEGAINVIISMYKDLPTSPDLRIVDYFEEYELGDYEDHEIMAFEGMILKLLPLFPDAVKQVKYLMRKDKLLYWYATTDLDLSMEFDGAVNG